MEAVEEGSVGRMPVSSANVTSVVSRNTTTVDDDSENHETDTSDDLHHTEYEFDLAVTLDTKDLDEGKSKEQGNDPGDIGDAFRTLPVVDDLADVRLKLLVNISSRYSRCKQLKSQREEP